MADYRAVATTCEAVVHLLRTAHRPPELDTPLEFKVYTSRDFTQSSIASGVSLFLYRIFANGVHRTPPGGIGPDGRRLRSRLPVDLHFLLTLWGKEASLQHAIAGWMMRLLEDHPVLPSGLLDTVAPEVFGAEETVEISLTELTNEDLLRIWEVLGLNAYQLSVPYVARVIEIESDQSRPDSWGEPVQERRVDATVITGPPGLPGDQHPGGPGGGP